MSSSSLSPALSSEASKSEDTPNSINWNYRWKHDHIGWHKAQPHKDLISNISKLPPPIVTTADRTRRTRILVPLCGKTVDMIYLVSQGYTVIGIEFVDTAIQEFFNDHKQLNYTSTNLPNSDITRYTTTDLFLTIYRADIYDPMLTAELMFEVGVVESVSSVVGVDCIWDRAALVAVNRFDRVKYVTKLLSLLTPRTSTSSGCDLLMNMFSYAQWMESGPPFAVTDPMFRSILDSIADGRDRWKDEPNQISTAYCSVEQVQECVREESIVGGKFVVNLLSEEEEWRPSLLTGNKFEFRIRTYTVTRRVTD